MFGILGQRFRDTQRKPALGAQLIPGHPLAAGLVAAWALNELGGTTALDASGGLQTGTVSSGGAWDAQGLSFNGSTYMDAAGTGMPGIASPLSFAVRVRVPSAPTDAFFGRWDDTNAQGWAIYGDGVFVQQMASNQFHRIIPSSLGTGWNDYVATSDGTSGGMTLYINGVRYSGGSLWFTSANTPGGFTMGAKRVGAGRTGQACQFASAAIWNRQLSQGEVAEIAARPFQFYWQPSSTLYSLPAGATPSGFKPWFANATKLAA